ncbi:hypothetical protein HDV05_007184 [Chytridiales sp. JEL 0842]|nr:hypothetical protein HDV05_007184 [Chytridiales sp. JEL 0842]
MPIADRILSIVTQSLKASPKSISIAVIIIASGSWLTLIRRFYQARRRLAHIPGPIPLPIFGDIFLIRKFLKDRKGHELRDHMRTTYGKISKLHILGMDVVAVADANAAKQVLNNSEQFLRSDSFLNLATGLFKYALFILPTSPVWKKHRKFIQPGFGPTHLRHAVDATNQVMDALFSVWDQKLDSKTSSSVLEVNMFHVSSSITIDVIGHVAFSYSYDNVLHYESPDKQHSLKAYNRAFEFLVERASTPRFLWSLFNIGESAAKRETKILRDTVMATIADKRASVKNTEAGLDGKTVEGMSQLDVLDRMLEVDWSDEEIVDEVIALFLAGGETSANTITFIFWLLDQHPHVLTKVREELDRVLGPCIGTSPAHNITWDELSELKYTEQVVKETLRLHPVVVSSAPRIVVDPNGVELMGKHVPFGTNVMVDVRNIHRSDEYWDNPMAFNPSRWDDGFTPAPGTYLPFLDGAHMCVGWKMAILEIKVVMARVLHRYRVSVVKDQKLNLVTSVTHGFKDGIQMVVERR